MTTLTADQAAVFRKLRPRVRPLTDAVNKMVSDVLTLCPHMQEHDPQCPVCRVYRMLADAANGLDELPDVIDTALERGPHPGAETRRIA